MENEHVCCPWGTPRDIKIVEDEVTACIDCLYFPNCILFKIYQKALFIEKDTEAMRNL
ncbi:hypothetical protein ACFLUG_00975 [Chloroflexota bacterium]